MDTKMALLAVHRLVRAVGCKLWTWRCAANVEHVIIIIKLSDMSIVHTSVYPRDVSMSMRLCMCNQVVPSSRLPLDFNLMPSPCQYLV